LCAKADGTPWTKSGFDSAWQKIKARLLVAGEIEPGLTLKGLRHTVATILAERGSTERDIADLLGQETLEMARHYSRRANKAKTMEATVTNLEDELNRRRSRPV
jgi:integrase